MGIHIMLPLYKMVIVPPGPAYGPEETVKFYPTLGHAGVAADGSVRREPWGGHTWSDIRNGVATYADDDSDKFPVHIRSFTDNDWYALYRSIINFDTGLLPVGSLITQAKVGLFLVSAVDSAGWKPAQAIVRGTDPDPSNVVLADYNTLLDTQISEPIAWDDLQGDTYNIFTIYDVCFDAITPGGVTKLGIRDVTYDAPNIPPPWIYFVYYNAEWCSRDQSLARSPYLEVTYKPLL